MVNKSQERGAAALLGVKCVGSGALLRCRLIYLIETTGRPTGRPRLMQSDGAVERRHRKGGELADFCRLSMVLRV